MTRHREIEDKAAEWLVRKEEPGWTAVEQAELDAWLEESMAHKASFWRVEHGWREVNRIRPFGRGALPDERDDRTPRISWLWPVLAAASIVGAVGMVSIGRLSGTAPVKQEVGSFQTAIGGERTIPLPDGSKVELNTATTLRTAVNDNTRDVWLDSGEAYFEVAHRAGEPFVVHAGDKTITVLGTKFSVRRDADGVIVNVVEGRVRVDDGTHDGGHTAIITAGDTAIARGHSTLIAAKSSERVENSLAWRDGMLSFDQTTLSEVAAEFNRYNSKPIIIMDPGTARIRIGGTFQASNVDAFVRLLHDAYGLKIEDDDTSVKISG